MNQRALPICHVFDLGDLSQAGSHVVVAARSDELEALARWAGVDTVRAFTAGVELRRTSQNRFAFEAELSADIVQSCVATLEPVSTHIARHLARELHYVPHSHADGGELTLAAGNDDVPEEINSLDYDLAGPLLEEFVLAIDPYPRKEGATFESPKEHAETPESPFAMLKSLKQGS
ncbi:MAG: hypothetical protein KGL97_02265 [Alphaproteobacteria bacterium]|nr:hypothetical protein [Alphaproteobacteria bacterium]